VHMLSQQKLEIPLLDCPTAENGPNGRGFCYTTVIHNVSAMVAKATVFIVFFALTVQSSSGHHSIPKSLAISISCKAFSFSYPQIYPPFIIRPTVTLTLPLPARRRLGLGGEYERISDGGGCRHVAHTARSCRAPI